MDDIAFSINNMVNSVWHSLHSRNFA